jgi:hypothetical protein
MLFDLLHMPLGDWHPRQVYLNEALRRQQAQSLYGFEALYEHILQDGIIPGAESTKPHRVRWDEFWEYAKKSSQAISRLSSVKFAEELDKRGIRRARSGGVTYRDFPPLAEARAKFAARFRNGWPWEMDIQDWAIEPADETLKAKMETML